MTVTASVARTAPIAELVVDDTSNVPTQVRDTRAAAYAALN